MCDGAGVGVGGGRRGGGVMEGRGVDGGREDLAVV